MTTRVPTSTALSCRIVPKTDRCGRAPARRIHWQNRDAGQSKSSPLRSRTFSLHHLCSELRHSASKSSAGDAGTLCHAAGKKTKPGYDFLLKHSVGDASDPPPEGDLRKLGSPGSTPSQVCPGSLLCRQLSRTWAIRARAVCDPSFPRFRNCARQPTKRKPPCFRWFSCRRSRRFQINQSAA